MELLTKELSAMNEYFEKNPKKVADFIKKAGTALVEGFGMVKDVIKFLVDNSGTLLSIAKAFVGFKLIQGAGGLLAGPFDMLASYSKAQKTAGMATTGFASKMTSAGNKIQGVATMLGAVYLGAKLLADKIDRDQDARIKRETMGRPQGFLAAATGDTMKTGAESDAWVLAQAKSAGLVKGGQIDQGRYSKASYGQAGSASAKDIAESIAMAQRRIDNFGGSGTADFEDTLAGGGNDKRALEAYQTLQRILDEESARNSQALGEFLKKHEGQVKMYLTAKGGLLSYLSSGGLAQDIGGALGVNNSVEQAGFRFGEEDSTWNGVDQGGGPRGKPKGTKKNGDTKVYINTIKVAADDPDRFAMRMVGAFKKANTKPTAARGIGSAIGGRPR